MTEVPAGWSGLHSLDDLSLEIRSGFWGDSVPSRERPVLVHAVRNGDIDRASSLAGTATRYFSASEHARAQVRPGDILFTGSGDIGKVHLARTEDLHVTNFVRKIRPDQTKVDPRFLFHACCAPAVRAVIERNSGGSTIQNLRASFFAEPWLAVPPLDEQRRIVDILEDHLSRLDAADGMLTTALRRTTAWQAGSRATALKNAGGARREISGVLAEPMRNGHSARAVEGSEPGIRTLTLTAVTRGEFSDRHTKVTSADPTRVRDLWLKPGDVLVQRSNTPELVGTVARYAGPSDWAVFPDLLIRLRADESQVTSKYLALALSAPEAHRHLRKEARGLAGSMPKIDQAAIGSTIIPVPDLAAQARVIQSVEETDSWATSLEQALEVAQRRSRSLRRSLLIAAFSGQLTASRATTPPWSPTNEGLLP